MKISEELDRIRKTIMPAEPNRDREFVSIMDPFKEKKVAAKSKEELNRFELLAFRKMHLPIFDGSRSRKMSFNTKDVEWVKDDVDSLNELVRRFLKFRSDYLRAVIYDNRLQSEFRDDRWIFKYDNGKKSFNRLNEYNVREKYMKEIASIPSLNC